MNNGTTGRPFPTIPLTTHLAVSGSLAATLCGATAQTTSTGSCRMSHEHRVVDCILCRSLMGEEV